jgi:hypothetical protein
MKWLVLVLVLSGPAFAQKKLEFKWTPTPSPGWTVCSTGTYCLTGFTVYETTTGTPVPVVSAPQTSTTAILSTLPPSGYHSYEVAQNGLNSVGAPVKSLSNPGVVVNCTRNGPSRMCRTTKSW